jgi:anti-sigma-K factor RskA
MSPQQRNGTAGICDTVGELIPDYAFGLTDPEETRMVEANLTYCPDAAEQLADFRRIQSEMRTGVSQVEPSPQMGARLMAAITAPAVPAPVSRLSWRPFTRPFNRVWLAAAVIALILTNVYWFFRVHDLTQRTNELAAQINQQQTNALVVTETGYLRWARLPAPEQNAETSAFLVWNAKSQVGLLYTQGFPALEVGKTYQLWLTDGDERMSAGTFTVDKYGKGALLFTITQPIDHYTWARITAEPEKGSYTPTGAPVVLGKLGY